MFSLEDAKRSLSEDGYVEWKDSNVGDIVSQLEERRFAYMSRWGLDYCDDHVFNDIVRLLLAFSFLLWASPDVY